MELYIYRNVNVFLVFFNFDVSIYRFHELKIFILSI